MDNESILKNTESGRAFLTALSDNLSDVVIITDCQLVIESWNDGAARIFGLSEAEVMGKHLQGLLFQHYTADFFETICGDINKKGKWEGRLISDAAENLDFTFLNAGANRIVIIGKNNSAITDPVINQRKDQLSSKDKRGEEEIILSEQKLRSV